MISMETKIIIQIKEQPRIIMKCHYKEEIYKIKFNRRLHSKKDHKHPNLNKVFDQIQILFKDQLE